jgi:hypothetical protein
MIWHPSVIVILVLDGLTFVLATLAAGHSFRIVISWRPQSASRQQIRLEIESEIAIIQQRWTAGLFTFSSLLYVTGIAIIMPSLVPGAMCGTGVIQATQGLGWQALALRFLGLALYYLIHVLDKLNKLDPRAPLSIVHARLMLVATPLIYMALWFTMRSLWLLDTHAPVNCCAIVYDQFKAFQTGSFLSKDLDGIWVGAFLLGGAGLLSACLGLWRYPQKNPLPLAGTIFVITLCWMPVAVLTLVRILAAYHYEVLHHQCPWCLFLSEHYHMGFLLFGALFFTATEGGIGIILLRIGKKNPALNHVALKRVQVAAMRTFTMAFLFMVSAGMPAVLWRLRYGVWMGG